MKTSFGKENTKAIQEHARLGKESDRKEIVQKTEIHPTQKCYMHELETLLANKMHRILKNFDKRSNRSASLVQSSPVQNRTEDQILCE